MAQTNRAAQTVEGPWHLAILWDGNKQARLTPEGAEGQVPAKVIAQASDQGKRKNKTAKKPRTGKSEGSGTRYCSACGAAFIPPKKPGRPPVRCETCRSVT